MIDNSSRTSTTFLPYNPPFRRTRFGLVPFRSPLLRESRELRSIGTNITRRRNATRNCSLFLRVLRCFTSPGSLPQALPSGYPFVMDEFPHSEISGSQATYRLPEAYRRLVTSFIAILGQGIHRALLAVSHAEHCMPQSLLAPAARYARRFLYLCVLRTTRLTGDVRSYSYVKESRASS